jgi:hypothetical protein
MARCAVFCVLWSYKGSGDHAYVLLDDLEKLIRW